MNGLDFQSYKNKLKLVHIVYNITVFRKSYWNIIWENKSCKNVQKSWKLLAWNNDGGKASLLNYISFIEELQVSLQRTQW